LRQWRELLKDYDLQIQYHPGKANAVGDALSRKAEHSSNTVVINYLSLLKELEDLGIQLVSHGQAHVQLLALTLQPSIEKEIRVNQESDPELQRIKQNLEKEKSPGFVVYEDGTLQFQNRLCVPRNEELRQTDPTRGSQYSLLGASRRH